MCSLEWHNCVDCGAEWHCDQRDSECQTLNGYGEQCFHCEYEHEEALRDMEKEEQRKLDIMQWELEHNFE